ncbi:putative glycerol-1-phosphate prenyltransferase [Algoriphagus ratkowskyi]|uniref:Geranylgeranylglyceryl phosphate synthase n=1 Tax=Algoriphagus ratkowskyi TaxID=57028 RepID=A0A2W7RT29_9BACT|nr:geranylgeranylglyceryl/heptaprenylglyceryl phosphate synthase [Algoriphagus ratkowskyi]PZX58447.1 putative glycerol-1-phosphate prenyltransferase [Algoriphagus ratkowskyi]TXD77686.1 geranylgeranylglyceryl/heptaprenylglyceryl phosphate synthase [Algoriphagus ratkowskyi]
MTPKSNKRVGKILNDFHRSGRKGLAWLVDPDKLKNSVFFEDEFTWIKDSQLDLIFVGGSQLNRDNFREVVISLKKIAGEIPVVIFPGSQMQLAEEADAILFISLISGRNPEYLIGHQVLAAPIVKKMKLEVLPTAYMLVNGGEITSVQYISQTTPLPNSKPNLAKATALAGLYLGMKYFFLDAGSGAKSPVCAEVIRSVKEDINNPIIVGGGLDSLEKVKIAFESGADLLVIGNAIEKDPSFLAEVLNFKELLNLPLNVN